jgi:hypothetical protein
MGVSPGVVHRARTDRRNRCENAVARNSYSGTYNSGGGMEVVPAPHTDLTQRDRILEYVKASGTQKFN